MANSRKILTELKKSLQRNLGSQIQDVILFGSYSKNQQSKYSDLDVLIVTKNICGWKERNLIRGICYDHSVDNDILIDSKIISQHEIEQEFWGKHPLIKDALKTGVYAE